MTASTKNEILTLLKRNGGHSVSELAAALNLAPVTVRQHLTRLDRDGLLVAEQQAGPAGRPHYVFRLTAKAHAAAFPRRSDRLVELLLREMSLLEPRDLEGRSASERTCLVLHRLATRLAEEFGPLLRGWSLQERVSFVTEVMHADGGLAEWEPMGDGFEIRDYNCLFHRLVDLTGGGDACHWHQHFLEETLGAPVAALPCPDAPGHCCRFVVREEVSTPVPAGSA